MNINVNNTRFTFFNSSDTEKLHMFTYVASKESLVGMTIFVDENCTLDGEIVSKEQAKAYLDSGEWVVERIIEE